MVPPSRATAGTSARPASSAAAAANEGPEDPSVAALKESHYELAWRMGLWDLPEALPPQQTGAAV